MKFKLKKNDNVRVIAGKYKTQEGRIINILKTKQRVQVEGLEVKKHQKPTQNDDGGIKNILASIHISNVALIDPKDKKKVTKIGYEVKDGVKTRIARKSKSKIS